MWFESGMIAALILTVIVFYSLYKTKKLPIHEKWYGDSIDSMDIVMYIFGDMVMILTGCLSLAAMITIIVGWILAKVFIFIRNII